MENKKPVGAWVVGLLDIIGGALGVLVNLLILVFGSTIGAGWLKMLSMEGIKTSSMGAGIIGTLYIIITLTGITMSILAIITGIYVLKLKNWARIVATIFAVLSLFSFPIGTIIGLIELYFLWAHEETKNAFH